MEGQEDDEAFPDDYDHSDPALCYVPENIPGRGCDVDLFSDAFVGCHCADAARMCSDQEECDCVKRSLGTNYDLHERLVAIVKEESAEVAPSSSRSWSKPVFECHSGCRCNKSSCVNRVVQSGPAAGLVVKETEDGRGRGLFIQKQLHRGRFVCCYAGEVLGPEEADSRMERQDRDGRMNYVIVADERRSGPNGGELVCRTVVDPTALGNIGRYANHSCDPNLSMHPVRVSHAVPHLALFARRDVGAGEELTFDYGDGAAEDRDHEQSGGARKECLCRAQSCRGYLPFSFTSIPRKKS